MVEGNRGIGLVGDGGGERRRRRRLRRLYLSDGTADYGDKGQSGKHGQV
jgi:hypothetical protein